MEYLNDSLVLSRAQFALTALFHILWPLLTVGLSIFLVFLEVVWLKTKAQEYFLILHRDRRQVRSLSLAISV